MFIHWMRIHVDEYTDHRTGEVNATALAEAACDEFDGYEGDNGCEVPEEYYDAAVKVAEWYEGN